MIRRPPLVVAALGGNALLRRGEAQTAEHQRHNVQRACRSLAELAAGRRLVVTHGNGPQVGRLASLDSAAPLDVLDAETEGQIGYELARELRNALPGREVVTVVTQVVVSPEDPRMAVPSKPVGPVFTYEEARQLADERGWTVAPDGPHWRRVVPSPEPLAIVEIATINDLVDLGTVVVCAGGGGIPVHRDRQGRLHGVEAVVDKDLATALLAVQLGADRLLLLTDVASVQEGFGTAGAAPIGRVAFADLDPEAFAGGSMRPKVEAACRFARHGGEASIGRLEDARALFGGDVGTQVVPR